jgi:hypothetical protein
VSCNVDRRIARSSLRRASRGQRVGTGIDLAS